MGGERWEQGDGGRAVGAVHGREEWEEGEGAGGGRGCAHSSGQAIETGDSMCAAHSKRARMPEGATYRVPLTPLSPAAVKVELLPGL